jgi:hypothetical protein
MSRIYYTTGGVETEDGYTRKEKEHTRTKAEEDRTGKE